MKKIILPLFLIAIITCSHAQNYLGVRSSNYAGILGASLNPSSLTTSKLSWDVNLISGTIDFDNNFLYIPEDSMTFLGFGNIVDKLKVFDFLNPSFSLSPSDFNKGLKHHFDPNDPDKTYDFYFTTEVMGPSFMFKFGKNRNAIGFTSGFKFYQVANDVPGNQSELAYSEYRDSTLFAKFNADDDAKENIMSWFEYGLSYSRLIYQKDKHQIDGGITLKFLQGNVGAFVKNVRGSYNVADEHDLYFQNASLDYGRVLYDSLGFAFDDWDITLGHYNDFINGKGFGGSIGFTYTHLRDSADFTYDLDCKKAVDPNRSNYVWRVGLALSDVGRIKFDDGANTFHLQADSANWHDYRGATFENHLDFDHALSFIFYGDSLASLRDDHFTMSLPTTLNLTFDWNIYKHFFLNATIIKGFYAGSGQGVKHPDVYALTPSYQQKWFEVSVPLSIISYHHLAPRVGLCVRAGWFYLGGDALGGIFGLSDMEGMDLYGGVHVFFPHRKLKDVPIKFDSIPGLTVNCGEMTPHTITYSNGLKGKRAKSGSVTSTYSEAPGPCGGDVIESWDVPGCHELHKQRTVHINAPPAPTFEAANNITVECGQAKSSKLRYSNGEEGDCIISGSVTSKLSVSNADSACGVDIIERWDTTDACGNAIHAERTIHVNAAPVKPQVVATSQEDMTRIQLSSQAILFKTGSPVLEPNVYQVLDQIAAIMIKYPNARWRVEGYCDITGSEKINLDLSNRRAEAVRDYLVKKGVKPENIAAYGYGKTHFIATNATAAGRAKNRRVEIKQEK